MGRGGAEWELREAGNNVEKPQYFCTQLVHIEE
jgi:hypothetical protein